MTRSARTAVLTDSFRAAAALTVGLLIYGLYTGLTGSQITIDEAWFLQLVVRTLAGDVPYRDFFLGVTPLSLYLSVAVASLIGQEIIALKAVMALILTATYWLTCYVAAQAGLGRRWQWLILLALLVYVPARVPGGGVPYTPLAYLFLLGSLSGLLNWLANRARTQTTPTMASVGWLVMAGLCAGLGFATKQNVGLLALGAVGLSLLICARPTTLSVVELAGLLTLTGVAFTLSTALALLPVALSGGLPGLLDYGFLNKGAYLQLGQVPYETALVGMLQLARQPTSLHNLKGVFWQAQYLLPFPALLGLLAVWFRGDVRQRLIAGLLLSFVAVALAGAYPLINLPHMSCAVPVFVIGLAWSCQALAGNAPQRWRASATVLAVVWLGFGLAGVVLMPLYRLASGGYQFSDLPSLRGPLVPVSYVQTLRRQADELRAAAPSGELFIMTKPAATYYLVSGLRNPTAYDYPTATDFGLTGEAELMRAIQDGGLPTVCLEDEATYEMPPPRLPAFIRASMDPIGPAGPCMVYRRRS